MTDNRSRRTKQVAGNRLASKRRRALNNEVLLPSQAAAGFDRLHPVSYGKTSLGQLDTVVVEAITDGGVPDLDRVGAACSTGRAILDDKLAPEGWGKKSLYTSSGGPEERERSVRCLYVDKVGGFEGEEWIPPMKAKQKMRREIEDGLREQIGMHTLHGSRISSLH
ncbi:MAG: hypothetical protein Q9171_003876 [Xanthocarpia ochracea]